MKISETGESGLIERLSSLFSREREDLVRGIGDDSAVIGWPAGSLLLATCDTLIEGVHFRRRPALPELPEAGPRGIGRRAAAVNLSDIAAMGGCPRFALVSLGAPDDADVEELEALCSGIAEALDRAGAVVAGGNTARSPERLTVDLCLLGAVEPSRLMTRDGARPGDVLCVTGDLGAAAAGLLVLETVPPGAPLTGAALEVARRHLAPAPRLAAARTMGADGAVTSCIDVSDGLIGDAGHLARAGGVSIRIDSEAVPVAAATLAACEEAGTDPLVSALAGGEDYELLCTVRPEGLDRMIRALEDEAELPLTPIGAVIAGPPRVEATRGGEPWDPCRKGFDHFRPSGSREDGP